MIIEYYVYGYTNDYGKKLQTQKENMFDSIKPFC